MTCECCKNKNTKGTFLDAKNRQRLIRISGLVGTGANLILAVIKIGAGLLVSSIAVISDGLNNLMDMFSSSIAIISYHISNKPADEEHPYGHGRFEYVASFIVSTLILLTAVELFRASIGKIFHPALTILSRPVLYGMLFSIVIKIFLYVLNRKINEKISSPLIKGVAKDSLFDICITVSILVGFFIGGISSLELDGWISLILALLIFYNGYTLMRQTVTKLLGEKVDDDLKEEIVSVILKGKYIRGYHHFDLHEYGRGSFFGSVHVEVPKTITVEEMHQEIDKLEHTIQDRFGVTITMHMDPAYDMGEDNEDSKSNN